jgi:uncharacterized membrane protein
MTKIEKQILINCPVNKVFQFVTDPENWTKYVTSLVDVKDLSDKDASVGCTFKWTYRMLGMNFHGKGQVVENIKNKRFVLKMEGSFPIQETYNFLETDKGTKLSIEIEYDLPKKIISLVLNKAIIEKLNKKEAENILSKIKIFCESM